MSTTYNQKMTIKEVNKDMGHMARHTAEKHKSIKLNDSNQLTLIKILFLLKKKLKFCFK